jgi:uncharacterized protein with HEPN domain
MPRDLLLYLEDIRDAIVSIRSYVGDRAFEEFVADRMCLDAVVLRFIIIGEATTIYSHPEMGSEIIMV